VGITQFSEGKSQGDMVSRMDEKNIQDGYNVRVKKDTIYKGWWVQIGSVTERNEALSIYENCKLQFPELMVDWFHDRPYYKIRAGGYLYRWQAFYLQRKLSESFPDCYLVKDESIPILKWSTKN
jgi:hypothetical protein